jgi:hypothetical protein
MTGVITFAPGQTFPGVALPKATTSSLGVVQVGAGLAVNGSGVLSTVNNGTVTGVTAGAGLGAPATGNTISTSGTLRLVAPTVDGLSLGGVKKGANIDIAFDGTISVTANAFMPLNNPYSYSGYQWPIPLASPSLPFPGTNGQVLTVLDRVAGTIGWTNAGTLSTITAGTGITVSSTLANATVSLSAVPTVVPATYGATCLIPTITVNSLGQVTSAGQTNAFPPYQNATVTAPPNLLLDFADNNTNWQWTLQANTVMMAPINSETGQSGAILLRQNSVAPFSLTWDAVWKWPDFTPVGITPTLSAVDMALFTVVSPTYIVIYRYITNIG